MKNKGLMIVLSLALVAGLFGVLPAPRALAGSCTSATSGNWSTAGTWGAGCIGTGGVPASTDNVTVAHTVTLTVATSAATVTVNNGGVLDLVTFALTANTLTINDGGEVKQGGSTTSPSGTITTRTYSSNSTYTFNGTQSGLAGTHPTYGNLKFIPTPGGNNTFALNLDVRGSLTIGLGDTSEIRFATSTTGRTHRIDGDLLIQSGTVVGSNGNNVSGSATINLGGSLAISGGTFRGTNDIGHATFNIKGNITNGGTWQQDDGSSTGVFTIVLNGTAGGQTIGGTNAISFENLEVNNANGASLNRGVDVTGILTLTSGRLTLGSNSLTLGSSATIGGTPSASSMVVADSTGAMCKAYNATGSFTFPIGDNTGTAEYSPTTLNFTAGSFSSAQACVRVTDAKHPNNTSTTDYLTRYWTVTQSGISSFSCGATFTYLDADIAGTEGNIWTGKWNGTTWSRLNAANTGSNTIGGTATSFSDFTGGESAPMAVTMADFSAAQTGDAVLLTWETNSELENRGFNLYRGVDPSAPDRQLNDALIPSQSPGNPGGFIYTWEDRADLVAGTTYYYWVEDVDFNGVATRHGPVSVDYSVPTAVRVLDAGTVASLPLALPLAGAGLLALAGLALAGRRRRG